MPVPVLLQKSLKLLNLTRSISLVRFPSCPGSAIMASWGERTDEATEEDYLLDHRSQLAPFAL
jgi:hypothetical protein